MRCLLRLLSLVVLIACVVPASAGAAGAGSTLLISRPDGFTPVPPAFDGSSFPGDVSADGRYAVFTTGADGFADGVDPDVSNVMVRDTQTGTTTLASRSDGA